MKFLVKHRKNEVKVEESAHPPSLLRSKASSSWNLTSPWTKMARQPYFRDVTVLLWRVFRFAAITVPRSRMLAIDASFIRVISTASRWDLRLWRQWGEGMWAYVSIEPAFFILLDTVHIVTLCYCFLSGVCARWKYSDTWPKTSGRITDRPGPITWSLATRKSHSTVGEALFLSSYFIYITCWGRW